MAGDPTAETHGRGGQVQAGAEVEELSAEECWTLLRKHNLGRLAMLVGERPEIFPVNFATAEGVAVFRTRPGTKLTHGPGALAALEIDGYDRSTNLGWSVVLGGRLRDITEDAEPRSARLRRLPVETAAPGSRPHWMILEPDRVSGRAFRGGWMVPGGYLG